MWAQAYLSENLQDGILLLISQISAFSWFIYRSYPFHLLKGSVSLYFRRNTANKVSLQGDKAFILEYGANYSLKVPPKLRATSRTMLFCNMKKIKRQIVLIRREYSTQLVWWSLPTNKCELFEGMLSFVNMGHVMGQFIWLILECLRSHYSFAFFLLVD